MDRDRTTVCTTVLSLISSDGKSSKQITRIQHDVALIYNCNVVAHGMYKVLTVRSILAAVAPASKMEQIMSTSWHAGPMVNTTGQQITEQVYHQNLQYHVGLRNPTIIATSKIKHPRRQYNHPNKTTHIVRPHITQSNTFCDYPL